MSDFREEEKLGKLYDTRLTHRLMKYLRPYRWQVMFAVAMSLAVAGVEIVGHFFLDAAWIDTFCPWSTAKWRSGQASSALR